MKLCSKILYKYLKLLFKVHYFNYSIYLAVVKTLTIMTSQTSTNARWEVTIVTTTPIARTRLARSLAPAGSISSETEKLATVSLLTYSALAKLYM